MAERAHRGEPGQPDDLRRVDPRSRHRGTRPDDPADQAGSERGDGRPTGVPGGARDEAEGRPSVVRDATARPPSVDEVPTEGDVDRGLTPSTEHDPGQDL
jgi:hypothetical protein